MATEPMRCADIGRNGTDHSIPARRDDTPMLPLGRLHDAETPQSNGGRVA
ncbi:hypothetical protein ACPW96_14360 [Micromonospora sp. DT81.3]